jgi:hypothetical protein
LNLPRRYRVEVNLTIIDEIHFICFVINVEIIGRIETYDTRCSDCSRRGYDLAFIQELISYIKYRIPTISATRFLPWRP